ncbi:hypothetical protein, partial [Pseudomonas sp. HY2-MNA-CIBAN-0224]
MIIGQYVADFCQQNSLEIDTALTQQFIDKLQNEIDNLVDGNGTENPFQLKKEMQRVMMDYVGIFRNGPELEKAI